MRTIGLIGGISWESTATYYRLINEGVRDRRGPTVSAPILLWSFDFSRIEALQRAGDWDALGRLMAQAAATLEQAGAEALLICANTMHRSVDAIAARTRLPLLHIVDTTAAAIRAQGLSRVGLLGTRYTMEHDFFRARMDGHGIATLVPDAADRTTVHDIIFDELVAGRVTAASRDAYRAIIAWLVDAGAQGIILGCTEIGMLIGAADSPVPLFDTAALHAEAAVDWVLGDGA